MKTIVLISCVKKKLDTKSKAKDLYISSFFKKSLAYAQSLKPDSVYILSAKYGLLDLNKEIDTYDLTLNSFNKEDLIFWSKNTLNQLRDVADLENDKFIFLAGENYRKYLVSEIKNYETPMMGLGIGKQLEFLKNKIG